MELIRPSWINHTLPHKFNFFFFWLLPLVREEVFISASIDQMIYLNTFWSTHVTHRCALMSPGVLWPFLLFSGFSGGGSNRPLCYRMPKYFQDMRHRFFQFPLSLTAGRLVLHWVLGLIPKWNFIFAFVAAILSLFHVDLLFIQHYEFLAKITFHGFYLRFIWCLRLW